MIFIMKLLLKKLLDT